MSKTKIYFILPLAGLLFLSAAIFVYATSESDIVYPVKELGNCKDKTACFKYCDNPDNLKVCVEFAEKHNLMSREDAEQARRFLKAGGKGPGGCTSKESCESYCDDVANINVCLDFAEKNGLMDPDELAEAKKVQQALAKGAKLPGGCRNKNACEDYCQTPDHIEECVSFAEAAGFMPPEELAEAKKYMAAIKKGVKPLPCRGKAECDEYCEEPGNFKDCVEFAEAAGFISSEEAEMARKTGGKGPGNCRGRDECESYCQNPANQETCFNFAKEHGLLSEEDMDRIEEGKERIIDAYDGAPEEVQQCVNQKLGGDFLENIKSGKTMPNESFGGVMQECFMQNINPEDFMEGPGGNFDDRDFGDESSEGMMQEPREPIDTSPEVVCTDPEHPGYNRPDCQLYRQYFQGGGKPSFPGNQIQQNKNLDRFLHGLIGLFFIK